MVTGDYYHTAIAVARGVGMVSLKTRLIIVQTAAEQQGRVHKQTQPAASAAVKTSTAATAAAPTGAAAATVAGGEGNPAASMGDNPVAGRRKVLRAVSFAPRDIELDRSSFEERAQVESDGLYLLGSLPAQRAESAPHGGGLVTFRAESASYGAGLVTPRAESASHGAGLVRPRAELASQRAESRADGLTSPAHMTRDLASHMEGTGADGLAVSLDNGDAYRDGNTLQAFRALSEVRTKRNLDALERYVQRSLGWI